MTLIPENQQIGVKFKFLTRRAKSLILQYSISSGYYLSAKSVKSGVHNHSAHIRVQTKLRRETFYQVYTLSEKITIATVLLHQKRTRITYCFNLSRANFCLHCYFDCSSLKNLMSLTDVNAFVCL